MIDHQRDTRHAEFQEALDQIEQEHHDYFKNRRSSLENRRDKIEDHCLVMHTSEDLHYLDWKEESDLPKDIRRQAFLAFRRVYGS